MAKRNASSSNAASVASAGSAKKRKLATATAAQPSAPLGQQCATTTTTSTNADHVAAAQIHLAQRLLQAACTRTHSNAVVVQLRRHRTQLVIATRRRHRTLAAARKMHALLAMASDLRVHLHLQRTQRDASALASVHRRIDAAIATAASATRTGVTDATVRRFAAELDAIVDLASTMPLAPIPPEPVLVIGPDERAVYDEDDAADVAMPTQSLRLIETAPVVAVAAPIVAKRQPLPLVELAPHQWIPPILWRIYESVEATNHRRHESQQSTDDAPTTRLCRAMRSLLLQLRDASPFRHLHILYRPPPPSSATTSTSFYTVHQSPTLQTITSTISAFVDRLARFANWLSTPRTESPRNAFDTFTGVCGVVQGFSIHFHYVLLYLYAVAMGRPDDHATPTSIGRQTAAHLHQLQSTIRAAMGLERTPRVASDALLAQSFTHFPEVLVFLDAWRLEEEIDADRASVYGFGTQATTRASVVDWTRRDRRQQRPLVEIADCFDAIVTAWRNSALGTSAFIDMRIEALGALEQRIKSQLRALLDRLYQQNVAAWMVRKWAIDDARVDTRVTRRRNEEEEEEEEDGVLRDLDVMSARRRSQLQMETPATAAAAAAVDNTTKTLSMQQQQRSRFRPVGVFTLHEGSSLPRKLDELHKSIEQTRVLQSPIYDHEVSLDAICCWSNDTIDRHEQEKEHIYDLQAQLQQMLQQQFVVAVDAGVHAIHAFRARDDTIGLTKRTRRTIPVLELCSTVDTMARTAVCAAETIALHGAAEALTLRPSLRQERPAIEEASERESESESESESDDSLYEDDKYVVKDEDDDAMTLHELLDAVRAAQAVVNDVELRYKNSSEDDRSRAYATQLTFMAETSRNLIAVALAMRSNG